LHPEGPIRGTNWDQRWHHGSVRVKAELTTFEPAVFREAFSGQTGANLTVLLAVCFGAAAPT